MNAWCNAGFSLYPDSLVRFAVHVPVNLTMMTLIVLGGLGATVLLELLGGRWLAHGPALAMTSLLLQPAAVAAAGLAWSRAARRRRADRMRARDELAPRPVAAAEPRATRPARGTEGS